MVDLASIQEASVANEIQQVGVELQALRAQLTTCPTCGSELTEEAKHKLLESV
jgi:DNA repair exonuclease SbcCD ATPase subunit